ncbi:MAG: hypothetical protein KDA84_05445, partial [Planctomycetaceae bacterium]|nr:hypothetical protein [Planctomycetaceae bacterium]
MWEYRHALRTYTTFVKELYNHSGICGSGRVINEQFWEYPMKNGDAIHFSFKIADISLLSPAAEDVAVGMNEVGAAKNAAVDLWAAGGPCPVIVFHYPEEKDGGIVHIDGSNAEQDGNDHESLIDRLLKAAPEISNATHIYVCYDPDPTPGLKLPNDLNDV